MTMEGKNVEMKKIYIQELSWHSLQRFLVAWTDQSRAPRTLGDTYIPNAPPVQEPRTRNLAGDHNKRCYWPKHLFWSPLKASGLVGG
jgi:hypothetical protein